MLAHGWCKGFFSIVSSFQAAHQEKTNQQKKKHPELFFKWVELTGGELRLQHARWHSKTKTTSRRRCYLLRPGWARRDTHSKRKREGLCEWVGWMHKRGGQVKRHERTSDGGGHQATWGGNIFIPNRAVTCTHIHVCMRAVMSVGLMWVKSCTCIMQWLWRRLHNAAVISSSTWEAFFFYFVFFKNSDIMSAPKIRSPQGSK